LERKGPTLPVTYVELSDDEERLVLATLDPLASLAPADEALRASTTIPAPASQLERR
jgi:hypothetical protein